MDQLKGTWRLTLLALRRDRIKLPIAVFAIGIMFPMFVSTMNELAPTAAEVNKLMQVLAPNPVMRLFGLPTGSEIGNLFMLRVFLLIAIMVALVSTFTVIRHSRQNEELGRAELVGANAVGRYAGMAASLIVAVSANIVIGTLAYPGLLGTGMPAAGALAMAVAVALVGIAFCGIAIVCAQLTRTSRGANSLAAASVGVAFLLSGIGSVAGRLDSTGVNVEPAWVTWLSPIGWGQLLRPFAGENWWLVLVFLLFTAGCLLAAMVLQSKRDVGSGLLSSRPGRDAAKPSSLSLSGLGWRLNRTVFIGWLTCIVLLAGIYGAVAGDIENLFAQSQTVTDIFTAASGTDEILQAYLAAVTSILGIFALAYATQISLRLHAEESRALEFLLATTASRLRWMLVQVGFIAATLAIMLTLSGLALGLLAESTAGNGTAFIGPSIAGALAQLPAILVLVGIVVVIFGLKPGWIHALAWTSVSMSVILGPFFASLFNFPESVAKISPFTHVPTVPPLENMELLPLAIMAAIGTLLIGAGAWSFLRRDIATS